MYDLKRVDLAEDQDLLCAESICKNSVVFVLEKEQKDKPKVIGSYCNFHSMINKEYYEWKQNIAWMNAFVWIPVFWLLIYIPTLKIGKSNITLKYQSSYERTTDGGSIELFNTKKSLIKSINLENLKKYKVWFWICFIISLFGQTIAGFTEFVVISISNDSAWGFTNSFTIFWYFITIGFSFLYFVFGIYFYKNKTKNSLLLFTFFGTLAMSKPFVGPYGFITVSVFMMSTIFIAFGFYRALNIEQINQFKSKINKHIWNTHLAMTILYVIAILSLAGVELLFAAFLTDSYSKEFFYITNPIWTFIFPIIVTNFINLYISENKRISSLIGILLFLIELIVTPFSYFGYGIATIALFALIHLILNILIFVKYNRK